MRSCRASRSASPVSAKPAVKKWMLRTPFAPASSSIGSTRLAGIDEMTWSTGPGMLPSVG